MGSVTANFTSEHPLHPAATELLVGAFGQGWADPTKIHRSSRTLNHLLEEARATFSTSLGVDPASLHFLGEPSLGFHLGINGLTKTLTVLTPATSRQDLFAAISQREATVLSVDSDGSWQLPPFSPDSLLAASTINLETGSLAPDLTDFSGSLFIDATTDPRSPLPSNWTTALWDSKSWSGPQGVGVFAIKDVSRWSNPLPHNDHRIVPGGVHPALVLASAVALESHLHDCAASVESTRKINREIRSFLTDEIGDVDIASPESAVPHLLSFSLLYIQAEKLVDDMEARGFSLDSGSACMSSNMEPSHVLAAMGRLTHGNIRLQITPEISLEKTREMLQTLKTLVIEQRSDL